jgi:hypothetical protein
MQKKDYNRTIEIRKQDTGIKVEHDKNQDITKLSYGESVKIYGEPVSTEEFENAKEGEVFPGIRAGIGKHYPSGTKIVIKEAIWRKNDSIEIAVWYTQKQNHWLPFSHFEYDKNTDF